MCPCGKAALKAVTSSFSATNNYGSTRDKERNKSDKLFAFRWYLLMEPHEHPNELISGRWDTVLEYHDLLKYYLKRAVETLFDDLVSYTYKPPFSPLQTNFFAHRVVNCIILEGIFRCTIVPQKVMASSTKTLPTSHLSATFCGKAKSLRQLGLAEDKASLACMPCHPQHPLSHSLSASSSSPRNDAALYAWYCLPWLGGYAMIRHNVPREWIKD